MKKLHLSFIFITLVFLLNCIGEDIRFDAVPEEIRFLNPIDSIAVSETYQLNVTYFNNIGEPEEATIVWASENALIASVNSSGLVTGISEGSTNITATVISNSNQTIENIINITITMDSVTQNTDVKSGTIASTSSYLLQGGFTLSEINNSNNLQLTIDSDYRASTSLPGLYLYLSNNPNSINGALEIGAVSVFQGAHSYTIQNTGINDFSYLLYWCKPFSVKVGDGRIN